MNEVTKQILGTVLTELEYDGYLSTVENFILMGSNWFTDGLDDRLNRSYIDDTWNESGRDIYITYVIEETYDMLNRLGFHTVEHSTITYVEAISLLELILIITHTTILKEYYNEGVDTSPMQTLEVLDNILNSQVMLNNNIIYDVVIADDSVTDTMQHIIDNINMSDESVGDDLKSLEHKRLITKALSTIDDVVENNSSYNKYIYDRLLIRIKVLFSVENSTIDNIVEMVKELPSDKMSICILSLYIYMIIVDDRSVEEANVRLKIMLPDHKQLIDRIRGDLL